jgi:hypothetical protein
MRKIIALLTLTFMPYLAHAHQLQRCDSTVYEVVNDFLQDKGLMKHGTLESNEISSDCSPTSGSSPYTIAAFGYDLLSSGESDDKSDGVFIGIVDIKHRKVISYNWQQIDEDATLGVGPNSLQIDTKRYKLNRGTEAIGLIYQSSAVGARCVNYDSENLITLFVQNGAVLSPVFYTYKHIWKFLQGCDAVPNSVPMEVHLGVSVSSEHTNGYRDLIVADKKAKEPVTLKYDGHRYVWPKDSAWWTAYEQDYSEWTLH